MSQNDLGLSNTLKQKLGHRGISEERLAALGLAPQPGESDDAFIRRALDAVCQQIKTSNPDEIRLGVHTFADSFQVAPDMDLDWSDLFPSSREWTPDAWAEIGQSLVDVRDALARRVGRHKPLRLEGKLLLSAAFLVGSVFNQPSEFRLIARQVHRDDGRQDWWDSASQPLVSMPLSRDPLVILRQHLASYFNNDELRTLCFDLRVEYEDLAADSREGRTRELVSLMDRHCRVPELIAKCAELRPKVAWPNLDDKAPALDLIYSISKDDTRNRSDAHDAILELSFSGNVTEQVDQYVAHHNLTYRRRVEVSIQGYDIASSEIAAAVARKTREALVELKPASPSGKVHIFANAPAALAILIGRWTNAVGKIQLYEYRNAEYVPSVIIAG